MEYVLWRLVRLVLGFLLGLFLVCVVRAQIDTPFTPAEKDLGDLYHRIVTSRFVIIGTVVKSEGVGQRVTGSHGEKSSEPGRKKVIVGLPILGGSLYSISVEHVLCSKERFDDRESISGIGKTVHIFIPRDQGPAAGGLYQETFLVGHRYMLFLAAVDSSTQEEWMQHYQMDSKLTYYRGEELSRGVVPLFRQTSEGFITTQPPVVEKITRLCEALQAVGVGEKLNALNRLAASEDPALRKEAEIAAADLKPRESPRPK